MPFSSLFRAPASFRLVVALASSCTFVPRAVATEMSSAAAGCEAGDTSPVRSFATKPELSVSLGAAVAAVETASEGQLTLAISGGSLPKLLAAGLVGEGAPKMDWSRWQIFYADERVVPLDHEDSNHKACNAELFEKLGVPAENVHTIDATLEPEACAAAYEADLEKTFGGKGIVFDLILLGMGPDGHTASLFPGHPLLDVEGKAIVHIDNSPKPPPKRITLTLPVINAAKRVFFVCTGSGKAENLAKILGPPTDAPALPAGRVKPTTGELLWFVDDAASAIWQASRL